MTPVNVFDTLCWPLGLLGFLLWGFSIGFVYIHASTHDRSTWFWMLVSVIPGLGITVYLLYFHWKTNPRSLAQRTKREAKVGKRLAAPKSREEREHTESIALMANFRDKEIEKYFIDGGDAERIIVLINKRRDDATKLGDSTAVASYDFYHRSINEHLFTGEVPRIILKLWGLVDEKEVPPPMGNMRKLPEPVDENSEERRLPITFVDQEERFGDGKKKV